MVQLCPRCSRANPPAAVFCHFDGFVLKQGAAATVGQFSQEFFFPSGRRCRTFDELVQACYYEWEEARNLLADGTFASFLAGNGRADLAKSAREGQANPDRDVALTAFLNALPATAVQGPKLGLSPRKLVVGPVRVGETRSVSVRLVNEGKGLLQGNAHVADGADWLKVVDADTSAGGVAVKAAKDQTITLAADTSHLTVGQNYSGKLTVVTNGGVAEVPVRLDLVVKPFARGSYAGANSPRDLARRMSKDPDAAVALLHSGEIQRWFASNGWAYPIAGSPAPGRAAVQQFFEELGLAKPPPITLSEQEFRFRCKSPEVVPGQVTLRTSARRIVYGRCESDSPWLRVKTPSVAGDFQVAMEFEVDSSQMSEDRPYTGTLKVIGNAGQAFAVKVHVDVKGNPKLRRPDPVPVPVSVPVPPPAPVLVPVPPPPRLAPQTAPPPFEWGTTNAVPPPLPPPSPVTDRAPGAYQPAPLPVPVARPGGYVRGWQVMAVGALVGFLGRALLVLPADLFARLLGNAAKVPTPGTVSFWADAPAADGGYLRLFVLATWWLGALAGVVYVWRGGGKATDWFCGLLAGAVAGLAGAATVGCLLVLGDLLPRLLMSALAMAGLGEMVAAVSTPLWLVLTVATWTFHGVWVSAVLVPLGRRGADVVAAVASPLSGMCRAFGQHRAADFLALRG